MNTLLVRCLIGSSFALAATAALAHGDATHPSAARQYDARKVAATDFGREGDPKRVTRTIRVDMTDNMRFTPADIAVRRGETIRFVVRNGGKLLHEMVLGTVRAIDEHAELMKKFPEMEHAEANMITVGPGQTGEVIWKFTKAGAVDFACLHPGHYDAGMKGVIKVTSAK